MAQEEDHRGMTTEVSEDLDVAGWLSKQSVMVEAAVMTTTSAGLGAAIGAFIGNIYPNWSEIVFSALPGGPSISIQAREFAVMTGVYVGISCFMTRLRGKEDVQTRMVAAFGSGAMLALVSVVDGTDQVMYAVTFGLFFVLAQAGLFKVEQKFSRPPQDVNYARTKNMLTSLGLQSYEKDFKKGLLTDRTLPLLTDSALRDVNIPPGPRLLILDHIERNPELKSRKTI